MACEDVNMPTDREVVEAVQAAFGVTRPELEHVLACEWCSLTGTIEPGPEFCLDFRREFRGWVPREPTPEEVALTRRLAALWEPEIRRSLGVVQRP